MTLKQFLFSFACLLLVLSPAAAQSPSEQAPLDQEQAQKLIEQKKELERKTLVLLDEMIASIPSLKLPENRALVQSSVADLLWTRDEKRARALFNEALNSLSQVDVKTDSSQTKRERDVVAANRQRHEIIQLIARRDPQMALEGLRSTRPSFLPAEQVLKERQHHEEIELEQSIALQVAANDPKLALQLAKDGLAKGFSLELINVLKRLQATDSEAASQLAEAIIVKLRATRLENRDISQWVAFEILQMTQPRHSGSALIGMGQLPPPRTPLKLNEQYLRDLVDLITTSALAEPKGDRMDNGFARNFLPSVMPVIEKWMPERASLLQKRMAEANRGLDVRTRTFYEYSALLSNGTVEALLDAAAKATSTEAREMLYEQVVWKAMMQGDEELARQIANDKIQDSSRRARMLEGIERHALWSDVMKGKLDEARRKIGQIKSKDERAAALSHLAFVAATKGEKKIALQLLEEARPLITMKPKNDAQLTMLMQLVRAYAVAEPARAFELIETLIDQANELISAAAILDGFVGRAGAFKKGELVMPLNYSAATMPYQDYGKQLAALALINFDRTKAAANRFQRKEVQIVANLFIAQGVLSERLGSGVFSNLGGPFVSH